MRGLRTTIALAAVLAGLGGYIYFVEAKRPSASEAEAIKAKAIDTKPDQIEQFTVKIAGGDTTTIVKTGGVWQITAPVAAKADQVALIAMTKSASAPEIQRVVEDAPTDLKQYGLDPPRVDVTVKLAGSGGTRRLLIGEKTATGGTVFAKLASDQKVILLASTLDDAFDKDTFALRDKAVLLNVDREKVDAVEVDSPRPIVELTRSGTDWNMKMPLQTRGDTGVVGELLNKLFALQMKSVAAQDAAETAKYGLDKPPYALTVGQGSARATLQIGGAADEASVYARDVSRPAIFTIDRSFVDELKKDPAAYRRKDVFDFETMDANSLEVTLGGHTSVYTKVNATAPGTKSAWREVSPTPGDVDDAKMQNALGRLSYIRAVSFVDPKRTRTGLESPAISVVVKYENGATGKKEDHVKLARVGADAYAERAGWADAGKLDATAYGMLVDALNDLGAKAEEKAPTGDKKLQE